MTKGHSVSSGLAECAHQGAEIEKLEGVDVDAKTVEEGCGNCARGEKVILKERDTGFVTCFYGQKWEWIAGRMPCSLNPVRYERRAK